MRTATACTRTSSARPAKPWRHCRKPEPADTLKSLLGQVAQLVERSPEKAGVGGSIPSLATLICSLISTRNCCFFRLCQIRAVDLPGCMVFAGLKLGSPFLVVPADNGGSITKDGCNHLDTLALP